MSSPQDAGSPANPATRPSGGRRGKHSTLQAIASSTLNPTAAPQPVNQAVPQQQPTFFPEYWPAVVVAESLTNGQLFKGVLRLNLTNASEGYVTVRGIRYDLLVKV